MFPRLLTDADRDRCVKELQQANSDGRLTLDEMGDRVTMVLEARTDMELVPAFRGLGPPPVEQPVDIISSRQAAIAASRPQPNREWVLGMLSVGLLIAAFWLIYTVGVYLDPGPRDADGIRLTVIWFGIVPGLLGLGVAVVATIGIWRRREWGRIIATVAGICMILSICGLPFGAILLLLLYRGARSPDQGA